MAKPGEIEYNFAEQDKDKEFQRFLNKSLQSEAEGVDLKKFEKGVEFYSGKIMS